MSHSDVHDVVSGPLSISSDSNSCLQVAGQTQVPINPPHRWASDFGAIHLIITMLNKVAEGRWDNVEHQRRRIDMKFSDPIHAVTVYDNLEHMRSMSNVMRLELPWNLKHWSLEGSRKWGSGRHAGVSDTWSVAITDIKNLTALALLRSHLLAVLLTWSSCLSTVNKSFTPAAQKRLLLRHLALHSRWWCSGLA